MQSRGKRPRLARVGALVAVCVAAVAIAIAALPDQDAPLSRAAPAPGGAPGTGALSPCGTATAARVASVDATVAARIYNDELRGGETRADMARITSYGPLLSALASNNKPAIQAAVHALVYMPHWHIVRLRVTRGSRLLADIGGPYIIAPVSGTLRLHGRTVGHYVTSVQDDAGYVKLVTRFIGVRVDLYRSGSFLMGTLAGAGVPPSNGSTVTVGGGDYRVVTLSARAFPTGSLQVALFVPRAVGGLAARSCQAVDVAAWGNVAKHVAARLRPLQTHYQALADLLAAVTGGHVYVRSGSRHLAGGAGPARLPKAGTVRFAGRTWPVFSWEPVPSQRVYFLTPGG